MTIAELRNKCRHLAERCLSDEPEFISDEYLERCLAGLTQGRTDALLPPSGKLFRIADRGVLLISVSLLRP